jgi:hypothetical protein
MRTLVRLWSCSCFLVGLAALTGSSLPLQAQTASAAPAAKSAAPTPNTASGFSIETEMLTYRALESNGEAIACDVAAYLYGTKPDFKDLPHGAICNVGGGPTNIGVIVLPFDRSVFADFQIWRSDMQTMAEFEQRGANACEAPKAAEATPAANPSQPEAPRGRGLTAAAPAAAAGATMFTPAGAAISTASGVLGLFAKDQEASPVGGTIEDQAFMDNVSRELREVNISVMMPSVYTPYTFDSIDPAKSPFVIALDKLLHTRDCLVASKGATDPDVKNIEEFLNVLGGTTTPAKSTLPTSATAAAPPAPGATPAPAAQPAAPSQSHLQAVLSADGFAQRLGADPATGQIPATAPQHLLLVKALESGGSVNKNTNIFGTKMSYSGGSVGTYALFSLNGDLECSGNVYDYAGYLQAKNFQKQLRAFKPDPASQVIFQRGQCKAK